MTSLDGAGFGGALWTHPEWIPAVVVLGLAALAVLAWGAFRTGVQSRLLTGAPSDERGPSARRDVLVAFALVAIGVALLGPRLVERTLRVPAKGVDVVLLLDVSRSMDATDVPPSRGHRSRRAAEELLRRLEPADRAALVVFGRKGTALTPLTRDKLALQEMVPVLDGTLIRDRGTVMDAGLRTALSTFDPRSERSRVLVVLSDGEEPRRSDLPVDELRSAGVRVIAGLFGSEAGASVPGPEGPVRNPMGEPVLSRRQLEPLGELARLTGGAAILADSWGDLDVDLLTSLVRRDAGSSPEEFVERRVRVSQTPLLAGLGLAFLLFELLLEGRRAVSRRHRSALVACVLLAMLSLGADRPGLDPFERFRRESHPGDLDARRLVELGLARAEAGRNEEAGRAFFAAAVMADEPEAAALAYYDLGVVALRERDYERARDAFFDALALDPDDEEARFNLEWTLHAMHSPERRGGGETERPDTAAAEEGDPREVEREPGESQEISKRPADPKPGQRSEPSPEHRDPAPVRELSPEEAHRWLDSLQDDPLRSLQTAVQEEDLSSGPRGLEW